MTHEQNTQSSGADSGYSDIPEGNLYESWRAPILSPEAFAALGDGDALSFAQLSYLANFALIAPTTHNTVPQRLRFGDHGRLEIWLDREFVLPESDAAGRQAAISIGCCLANVVTAARCFGWAASVEVESVPMKSTLARVASEPRYVKLISILFRQTAESLPHEWLLSMQQRKMCRADYDDGFRLDERLADDLKRVVGAYAGVSLHLLCDAPTKLFLSKFQELADATVYNRDAFAMELGHWFLPNDSSSPVGIRGRECGLSDAASLRVHRGLLREIEILPDEIAGFTKAGYQGMRSSSAIGVITVESDTLAHRIAAGQAYEEAALLLTRAGIATAMHAAITEVEPASLALRGRLRTLHRPTVVFRIGKPLRESDQMRPHSARPRVDQILVPAQV